LHMAAAAQIPNVHLMSVFTGEEQVGLQPIFDHVRCAPFAGQEGVEPQMPPKIIMQELRAPVHLPLAQNLERLTIEHENTSRAVATGRPKSAAVNALRPTVNGVE